MRLTLASRRSDLAKIQALQVAAQLRKTWPGLEIEHHFRESLGDLNLQDPLWQMPERGVFTEDFVQGLESGEFDAVVHSWKDLPTESRPQTQIIATLPREDVRDVLILRGDIKPGTPWRILSSSPRRAENLRDFFSTYLPTPPSAVEFIPVRGNVPRRLQKLHDGEGDGLIVAKAALDRLLGDELLAPLDPSFLETQQKLRQILQAHWALILPVELNPPAAAQGALAIEIKRNRSDLTEIFARINCAETFSQVQNERSRLRAFGGGCHLKIGICEQSVRGGSNFHGILRVERGQTPEGSRFFSRSLEPLKPRPERRWAGQNLRAPRATDFFSTHALSLTSDQRNELRHAHWFVAHRHALTPELLEEARLRGLKDPWIWCSGLTSWRKLAQAGVWVRGCDEGLGRQGPSLPHSLKAFSPPGPWLRLSHAESPSVSDEELPNFATYRHVRRTEVDLRTLLEGGDCYYWHSAQLCKEALRVLPELREREHACGLGHTATELEKALGFSMDSRLFLNEEEWRNWCASTERNSR